MTKSRRAGIVPYNSLHFLHPWRSGGAPTCSAGISVRHLPSHPVEFKRLEQHCRARWTLTESKRELLLAAFPFCISGGRNLIRSHLSTTHTSRYRPVGPSVRRDSSHSSPVYGARVPTQQSGQQGITLWVANCFPPGWRHRDLKYIKYDCITLSPPDRKTNGDVTHGW